jgi:arsenate reductase (thioredoxin)
MSKMKVLFICVHNSARSQMAEAWLNHLYGERFEAESAGLEAAGKLNPLAVSVMKEADIDISGNTTQKVFDVFRSGRCFDYVITVCDQTNAERCPIFPGIARRVHWTFSDPARLQGTEEEQLAAARKIRDEIRMTIDEWVASLK